MSSGSRPGASRAPLPSAPWHADLSDGSYQNPVLCADYSDPDAIRVGDDYWMVSSSFSHVPGLPLLHSRDLVNWRLVNHALPRLYPQEQFTTPRHGGGVWAPALRHHAGLFWIFYPDPDSGIWVTTTADPLGAWSTPRLLKAGRGLIDPCPLWVGDSEAWLVHGWAKSRSGINNRLTLHRMSPDALSLLDEGRVIINGDEMPGWHTIEGPKLYFRNGWYYVFAPAGGVSEGYQAVFRSRKPEGPYEVRTVLAQGLSPINGPHQGAWVDTPNGQHWFLHFQDRGPHGRVVHLQPMRWRKDDWPEMGINIDKAGCGEPVLRHGKPEGESDTLVAPLCSDRFAKGKPGLQWQWQANAVDSWILPSEQGLRLAAVPQASPGSLYLAPNLLLQKFPAPAFRAEVFLDGAGLQSGDRAGLIVFGYAYAWIGLERGPEGLRIVHAHCEDASNGASELCHFSLDAEMPQVRLKVAVAADGTCSFAYAMPGAPETSLWPHFKARQGKWVGAKLGLFASSLAARSQGSAHFGPFLVSG